MQQPPQAQPPQPPATRYLPHTYAQPPMAKQPKILLIVLASVGGALLAGCACCALGLLVFGSMLPGGKTGSTSRSRATIVGDTITVDNVSCTLASATVWQAQNPIPGTPSTMEYVRAHVRLVNGTSGNVNYIWLQFHVRSSDGVIIPAARTPDSDSLGYGELSPGGTVEGDILLEVKQGDHGAEMTWQPNLYSNSDASAWLLGM